MKRYFIIYILIISLFTYLSYEVIGIGSHMVSRNISLNLNNQQKLNNTSILKKENIPFVKLSYSLKNPLALFLFQILFILIATRLFAFLLVKIRQPSVIGEIIAGIALGPSLLGLVFPNFYNFLFPIESIINLSFLSQIGLIFFMFIVGMELNLDNLKRENKNAIAISHIGIFFSFFLGVCLSYFIYEDYAPVSVSFQAFALFMGISMSITAFPVLARIVKERGLSKTQIGMMAITCAAVDDITAWCILAFVIAVVKSGGIDTAITTVVFAIIYIAIMFKLVRKWMVTFFRNNTKGEQINTKLMSISFFVLLLSSFTSELIGIHALFGAFLAGVIIPRSYKVEEMLTEKLHDVSTILLLPIFFALTGLRTNLHILSEGYTIGLCIVIITVAIIGKFGGSATTARIIGYNSKDALLIGAFMNTRGLMELIVLNIGYDLGILSPTIFAIMVLMALLTTFMTSSLLDLINLLFVKRNIK